MESDWDVAEPHNESEGESRVPCVTLQCAWQATAATQQLEMSDQPLGSQFLYGLTCQSEYRL